MWRWLVKKTVFILVLTLPLTYGLLTVYLPYHENPAMYNETRDQVFQYVNESEPVTLDSIAESNNLSNFQARYIASRLSQEKKVVKCPDGIRPHNCLASAGLKQISP